jgi:membrane glycosyltransferase
VLFATMMLMTFAPKIATIIDVLMTPAARRSYSGTIVFGLNILAETVFMALLFPIIALSHTIFLARLIVLRSAGTWTGQLRQSHAVPWRLAFGKLWPHAVTGFTILAVVATKAPNDIGFALLGSTGLLLAVPFAVATASPLVGALFARIGIGRIPEENEVPIEMLPLHLPAVAASAPVVETLEPQPRNV